MKAIVALLLLPGLFLVERPCLHAETNPGGSNRHPHAETTKMQRIPKGSFKPFLRLAGENRAIEVATFYIDVHAVTNAGFLRFVRANPSWARSKIARVFADSGYLKQWLADFEIGDPRITNSPVTNISWFAANAYCKWLGKRLPTLAEWEYAASARPSNISKRQDLTRIILEWYDHPAPVLLPPVQSTYVNNFGLYDMHGLVWEWVEDFNSVMLQAGAENKDPAVNALFCGAGGQAAANKEDYAAYMRYAFRESLRATYTVGSLGFRCAKDAPNNK
ncbi:MAG TPA: formylglycine-generating enzyme family protein [Puia sp.]|uniref:formylglycine-generating enzyme family protein n=1 Tax=Puia sp. TaxID=2045100 RepID=UPI002C412AC8|nr:formylglycine-generating enzyme family protein [Puia sp.]HVU94320.1 formylglycine-generating enzyme family protein [Puia sp.]